MSLDVILVVLICVACLIEVIIKICLGIKLSKLDGLKEITIVGAEDKQKTMIGVDDDEHKHA